MLRQPTIYIIHLKHHPLSTNSAFHAHACETAFGGPNRAKTPGILPRSVRTGSARVRLSGARMGRMWLPAPCPTAPKGWTGRLGQILWWGDRAWLRLEPPPRVEHAAGCTRAQRRRSKAHIASARPFGSGARTCPSPLPARRELAGAPCRPALDPGRREPPPSGF
jgi:hypothetical protein